MDARLRNSRTPDLANRTAERFQLVSDELVASI